MSNPGTPAAFSPPDRLLLGPGPSNAAPSVLQTMQRPLVGHLDPTFIGMMEEIDRVTQTGPVLSLVWTG